MLAPVTPPATLREVPLVARAAAVRQAEQPRELLVGAHGDEVAPAWTQALSIATCASDSDM